MTISGLLYPTRRLLVVALALLAAAGAVRLASEAQAEPGRATTGRPAQTQRGGLTLQLAPFASGLNRPVVIANSAVAGDNRLFIAEQDGLIRVVTGSGSILPTPFLNIDDRVGSVFPEQGLLGLAFHPSYGDNGYFYVNYTDNNGDTRVSRFHVTGDPDVADPDSELLLLPVDQPYENHNGGDLHFGPEGYLYISLGDGGSGGDPENRAQRLDTLLGKILRLDVDVGLPYGIPADNPFAGDADPATLAEIWAYGLRNPWRFSFDRLTGEMFIGDVGQDAREEISWQPADSPGGENYGWRCFEGNQPYNLDGCPYNLTARVYLPAVVHSGPATLPRPSGEFVFPIFDYPHYDNSTFLGCAVTGGAVYRGSDYPALAGYYVFADYCSGRFWLLQPAGDGNWLPLPQGPLLGNPSAFGEDAAGELYVADHNGSLHRVTASGDQ